MSARSFILALAVGQPGEAEVRSPHLVARADRGLRAERLVEARPRFVEITSGVEEGDQVVVGGLERLTEGAAVRATVVQR